MPLPPSVRLSCLVHMLSLPGMNLSYQSQCLGQEGPPLCYTAQLCKKGRRTPGRPQTSHSHRRTRAPEGACTSLPVLCGWCSDEEDDVWGRRRPLLSRTSLASGGSERASLPGGASDPRGRREDPWSVRMRDKYGLDTTQFGYNPEAGGSAAPPANLPEAPPAQDSRRCLIM